MPSATKNSAQRQAARPKAPEVMTRGNDPDLLVQIGDLHSGSWYAATPPGGFQTDQGHTIEPNSLQRAINRHLASFIGRVEEIAAGRSYGLNITGDLLEGSHHRAQDLMSANKNDQRENCIMTYRPLVDKAAWVKAARGTAAHAGQDSEDEEVIAAAWGAEKNAFGKHTSQVWWYRWHGHIVQMAHHVPTSGRPHTRASGPWGEMAALIHAAGEVGSEAADIVMRGHRHIDGVYGEGGPKGARWVCVNPPWVGPNGWSYKTPGPRTGNPRVGGIIIEKFKDGRVMAWPEAFFISPKLAAMGEE